MDFRQFPIPTIELSNVVSSRLDGHSSGNSGGGGGTWGEGALVAGSAVISDAHVAEDSKILFARSNIGTGGIGELYKESQAAGTFTIKSTDPTDNSTFIYLIGNPASTDVPPDAPDTTSPTVTITAPANNAVLDGATNPFTATASDNEGVRAVRFYIDGTLVASEDTTAPYSVNIDTTSWSAGSSHTLTAVAYDGAGNASSTASITVTKQPAVDVVIARYAVGSNVDNGIWLANHSYNDAATGYIADSSDLSHISDPVPTDWHFEVCSTTTHPTFTFTGLDASKSHKLRSIFYGLPSPRSAKITVNGTVVIDDFDTGRYGFQIPIEHICTIPAGVTSVTVVYSQGTHSPDTAGLSAIEFIELA